MNELLDSNKVHQMSREDLSKTINDLIDNDFHALIQVMYRMDINEKLLRETLLIHTDQDAGDLIADLIMDRQKQKLAFKNMFKQEDNIPEDEKW